MLKNRISGYLKDDPVPRKGKYVFVVMKDDYPVAFMKGCSLKVAQAKVVDMQECDIEDSSYTVVKTERVMPL